MDRTSDNVDLFFKSSLKNIELEPSDELVNKMASSLGVKKGPDWANISLTFICIVAVLACIFDFTYIIGQHSSSSVETTPVTTTLHNTTPALPTVKKAPVAEIPKVEVKSQSTILESDAKNKPVTSVRKTDSKKTPLLAFNKSRKTTHSVVNNTKVGKKSKRKFSKTGTKNKSYFSAKKTQSKKDRIVK